MDICSIERERPLSDERIRDFLSNKEKDILTGPRRMGRENLVTEVSQRAGELGLDVSVYPDITGHDAVFFMCQWDIGELKLDTDVLYGQDLCHQVPAIVRYRS